MTEKSDFNARLSSSRGASLIEYAVLLMAISIVAVVSLKALETPNKRTFCKASAELDPSLEWNMGEDGSSWGCWDNSADLPMAIF